jgi:lipopolysaccharide transport system ATP-binding protein
MLDADLLHMIDFMCSDVAITVKGLGKSYRIYERPADRLKQTLAAKLHRALGTLRRTASRPPVYFREFWALQDVSFDIRRGETVGIIGRNGSGKSTLLQLICGTLTPSQGELEVHGRVAALLELGAGFNPEFTGRENVYMNGTILGLSKEQIDARYEDIVAFADIGEFIDQPVKTYSSGMFVRLAFAVIAHVDADILIIDEALAVGDAVFTQKCMRFLRRFKESGTVLFVSHDISAVVNLCQRAIWLDKGHLKMAGTAKAVCEAYQQSVFEEQHGPSAISQSRSASGQEAPSDDRRSGAASIPASASAPAALAIEQFHFDPDRPGFGAGGIVITDVGLLDSQELPLNRLVEGLETVIVSVRCRAKQDVEGPIVGFYIKDRLGQTLFGENTYQTRLMNPLSLKKGQSFVSRFAFTMPILPTGDYSICAAVAEGTQQEPVQHHWIHDALIFKVHASTVQCGLMGIPMQSIEMSVDSAADIYPMLSRNNLE